MEPKTNHETYREKEEEQKGEDDNILEKVGGGIKKLWGKTVFPEKIKAKRQEKEFHKKLKEEARLEAQTEIRAALKEKYRQQEVLKATESPQTGKFWGKLAKGFEGSGIGSNEKMSQMLGGTPGSNESKGGNDFFSDDKLSRMMGKVTENPIEQKKKTKKKTKTVIKNEQESSDPIGDKIRRMLG